MKQSISPTVSQPIINRRRLYIEQYGPRDGLPVVLLHHGLGSTRAWKGQVAALAEAGFRAVVYDRWGYGRSEARRSIDMPAFQEDRADLLALFEYLNLESAGLVGHSDGGTIALYFAAQFPQRLSALVVIAAHIYLEAAMAPGIERVRQRYETDALFREGFRNVHGEQAPAVFRNWYEGWTRPAVAAELLSWDMRPLLAQIACPALVVQGALDEHATPQHARDLAAAIPAAQCWLAPGAGHMFPQEQPERFNPRLLEFLVKTASQYKVRMP
jgi:pimeloyl-ACP methyl ester carboxylesterase